ncbi:MAG: macrophage infectivity potentiator Mip [Gammaproteobacteria bacterium]|nr:MAG: macrophage infectivity potentiator Mip [Gammaproteobacteria bacterium]
MRIRALLGIALLSFVVGAWGAEQTKLKTDQQKFSYAIGYQIAESVKRQGLDIDVEALVQAIRDDLGAKELQISLDEMRAAVVAYQQKVTQELAQKNQQVGDAFLAENKKKDGVVETASGLQYQVMQAGKGKKPQASDTVVVHYRGYTIAGNEFDSSYKRGEPATFQLTSIIPGWQEVLLLMQQGAKWKAFIPPTLAYGDKGAGEGIGPNETLIFEIELVEIKQVETKQ